MGWLESGVFWGVRADGGVRNNNTTIEVMFSVQSVP
jgi:hypothetical protein